MDDNRASVTPLKNLLASSGIRVGHSRGLNSPFRSPMLSNKKLDSTPSPADKKSTTPTIRVGLSRNIKSRNWCPFVSDKKNDLLKNKEESPGGGVVKSCVSEKKKKLEPSKLFSDEKKVDDVEISLKSEVKLNVNDKKGLKSDAIKGKKIPKELESIVHNESLTTEVSDEKKVDDVDISLKGEVKLNVNDKKILKSDAIKGKKIPKELESIVYNELETIKGDEINAELKSIISNKSTEKLNTAKSSKSIKKLDSIEPQEIVNESELIKNNQIMKKPKTVINKENIIFKSETPKVDNNPDLSKIDTHLDSNKKIPNPIEVNVKIKVMNESNKLSNTKPPVVKTNKASKNKKRKLKKKKTSTPINSSDEEFAIDEMEIEELEIIKEESLDITESKSARGRRSRKAKVTSYIDDSDDDTVLKTVLEKSKLETLSEHEDKNLMGKCENMEIEKSTKDKSENIEGEKNMKAKSERRKKTIALSEGGENVEDKSENVQGKKERKKRIRVIDDSDDDEEVSLLALKEQSNEENETQTTHLDLEKTHDGVRDFNTDENKIQTEYKNMQSVNNENAEIMDCDSSVYEQQKEDDDFDVSINLKKRQSIGIKRSRKENADLKHGAVSKKKSKLSNVLKNSNNDESTVQKNRTILQRIDFHKENSSPISEKKYSANEDDDFLDTPGVKVFKKLEKKKSGIRRVQSDSDDSVRSHELNAVKDTEEDSKSGGGNLRKKTCGRIESSSDDEDDKERKNLLKKFNSNNSINSSASESNKSKTFKRRTLSIKKTVSSTTLTDNEDDYSLNNFVMNDCTVQLTKLPIHGKLLIDKGLIHNSILDNTVKDNSILENRVKDNSILENTITNNSFIEKTSLSGLYLDDAGDVMNSYEFEDDLKDFQTPVKKDKRVNKVEKKGVRNLGGDMGVQMVDKKSEMSTPTRENKSTNMSDVINNMELATNENLSLNSLRDEVYNLEGVVHEKQRKLEELQRAVHYKQIHDTQDLKRRTGIWKNGCKQALDQLLSRLKENMPNMNLKMLMARLSIQPEFLDFDEENDCFK